MTLWGWIIMDFIMKLLVLDKYDIIMVVIDKFIKYIYIILTIETINIKQIVNIIFKNMIINYRLLSKITLDYNKLFTLKI